MTGSHLFKNWEIRMTVSSVKPFWKVFLPGCFSNSAKRELKKESAGFNRISIILRPENAPYLSLIFCWIIYKKQISLVLPSHQLSAVSCKLKAQNHARKYASFKYLKI